MPSCFYPRRKMSISKIFLSCLFCSFSSVNIFALFSVDDLTLEEKVGQTLMAHFTGSVVNEEAKLLLEEAHVGGIIYYTWANGLESPEQVQALSIELQELSSTSSQKIPLFIAVDQEGGVVNRLQKGFTLFPGNYAIALTEKKQLAKACGLASGKELFAVGVNMNLSPVVDVNSNSANPIIGIRSFSESPEQVVLFAREMIQGYHQANIMTCLKHFPGHGDTSINSHESLPVIHKSVSQLENMEFFPFKQLLSEADLIMTAHVKIPELDPKNPATLSFEILEHLLRKRWGYDGVIISDSLMMQAILDHSTNIETAAMQAFNAGCDILCLGGKDLLGVADGLELKPQDVIRIHRRMVEAVKSGEISEKRLNLAVERILKLKNLYGLSTSLSRKDISENVFTPEHQKLAEEVAEASVRVVSTKTPLPLDLKGKKIGIIAPGAPSAFYDSTLLFSLGDKTRVLSIKEVNPSSEDAQKAHEIAKWADFIILFSSNAWKHEGQKKLLEALIGLGKPTALIAIRDPWDCKLFPHATIRVATSSPVKASIEKALEVIAKR